MTASTSPRTPRIAAWLMMAAALFFILHFGLLSALFAGLLVHALVHRLAPLVERRVVGQRARLLVVAGIGAIVVGLLALAIWGGIVFFHGDAGNMQALLQRLADILDASRAKVPEWAAAYMPSDADSLREMLTHWLREHAADAQLLGERAGRAAAHILIGMIIGAMVALHDASEPVNRLPLAAALAERVARLADAFERIVFAQVRIAAINAVLTAIYLMVVLPLAGIQLPLTKTMVLVTFLAGLLPVIGNLISNAIVVLIALSHSLETAMGSLAFLVVIHKLEYFLNARIIGGQIQARAWELLVAMLAAEAAFGLYGVIAAPVFYAYVKTELMAEGMV